MSDVAQQKVSARRNQSVRLPALLAGLSVALLGAGVAVDRLAPRIVEIFQLSNILSGNTASVVESELAYQIIGHVSLVAVALSFCLAGSALLRIRWDRSPSRGGRFARGLLRRPWAVVSVFVALVFVSMLVSRLGVSTDGYFVGLDDDAMISLRYAWNLAHGKGLVYNAGERVEGYTNFLWTVIAAIPFLFGASQNLVGLLVLVTNFVIIGATVFTMNGTLRRLGVPRWAIFFAALGYVFDCNTVYFGASGLETVFLASLTSAAVYFAVSGRAVPTFIALGAIPLARSDGALVATLLTCVASVELRRRRTRLVGLPFVFIPLVCHVAWRKLYYGEWYPNTYFLKMLDVGDRLPMGIGSYGFRLCWMYGPMLFLLLASVALRRHRSMAFGSLVTVLAQGAYGVYVGGDAFWFVRFLAPTLPLLYMGLARVLGAFAPIGTRALPTMLTLGTLGLALTPVQTEFGRVGETVSAAGWIQSVGSTARWMRANLPPGALSTTYPAGGVPYFAPELRFIDVLGKNDRHIGHLPHYESLMLGHNRFDFDYVYNARKPDVALVDRACAFHEAPRYMNEGERAALRQHDLLVSPAWDFERTNPTFIELYSPNAVHFVGGPRRIGSCMFLREGSSIPQFWSANGRPPRARSLAYVFGAENADERIALGGRWQIQRRTAESPGFGRSTGASAGEGAVDVWIETSSDIRAAICIRSSPSREERLEDPADEPIVVNGVSVAPASEATTRCTGDGRTYVVPAAVLGKREMGTRLVFPASLEVEAVAVEVRP